jgi:hypothetical protein
MKCRGKKWEHFKFELERYFANELFVNNVCDFVIMIEIKLPINGDLLKKITLLNVIYVGYSRFKVFYFLNLYLDK